MRPNYRGTSFSTHTRQCVYSSAMFSIVRPGQSLYCIKLDVTVTGSLLGRYKQPSGGLLGLAAGMMAVIATSSLASQVLWGTRLGSGPSLAWAGVGALSVGLIWRYQVCMPVLHVAVSTLLHLHMHRHMLCVKDLNHAPFMHSIARDACTLSVWKTQGSHTALVHLQWAMLHHPLLMNCFSLDCISNLKWTYEFRDSAGLSSCPTMATDAEGVSCFTCSLRKHERQTMMLAHPHVKMMMLRPLTLRMCHTHRVILWCTRARVQESIPPQTSRLKLRMAP